jgi:hypothetical protein
VMGKAAKRPEEANNTGRCQKWDSEGLIVARKGSKEPRAKGPWRMSKRTQKSTELIDGTI